MPAASAPVKPVVVGTTWVGAGIPALWGLEWELNERGTGEKRGSDLVTGRTGARIRSVLGYLVPSKLIFHSASRQMK